MPAKNLLRVDEEGIYSHIYNKGVEKRTIFSDSEDYEVFLGFLKDYLTAPKDPNSTKKDFKVRGRVFRGSPHQPKNYFNKIELIAYSLMPDHFHLLLHQKNRGSLESFIRSLCTRYSMYFNKKYKRSGSLFNGPYKSVLIKHGPMLPYLTYYFHHAGGYSSYPEYLGEKQTLWVKPKVVLSFFDKGTAGYKYFVEKYELTQKHKGLIQSLSLESESVHLGGRDLASSQEKHPDLSLGSRLKLPAFMSGSLVIFLLLFTLGARNINISSAKNFQPLPSPEVLSETDEAKPEEEAKPKEEAEPVVILTVKMKDASSSANIRQKPTISSEKIGEAKNGDTFEFVSNNSDWFEVKLQDGSTGFILGEFIEEEETNK